MPLEGAAFVDDKKRLQLLTAVAGPLAEMSDRLGYGSRNRHRHEAGSHDAASGILVVFEQLAHGGRLAFSHQVEELFALFVGQVAEQVRSVIRRHFLDQVGEDRVVEIFGDAEHGRRVRVRQSPGCQRFGDQLHYGLLIFFIEDAQQVSEIGRVLTVEHETQRRVVFFSEGSKRRLQQDITSLLQAAFLERPPLQIHLFRHIPQLLIPCGRLTVRSMSGLLCERTAGSLARCRVARTRRKQSCRASAPIHSLLYVMRHRNRARIRRCR